MPRLGRDSLNLDPCIGQGLKVMKFGTTKLGTYTLHEDRNDCTVNKVFASLLFQHEYF
jgi:hypothetical protein